MSIETPERALRHALEAASHELAKMARRMDRLYDLPADGKRLRKIVATLDSLASGLVADEGRALGTTPTVLPEPISAAQAEELGRVIGEFVRTGKAGKAGRAGRYKQPFPDPPTGKPYGTRQAELPFRPDRCEKFDAGCICPGCLGLANRLRDIP
jgi:hypothetical protein